MRSSFAASRHVSIQKVISSCVNGAVCYRHNLQYQHQLRLLGAWHRRLATAATTTIRASPVTPAAALVRVLQPGCDNETLELRWAASAGFPNFETGCKSQEAKAVVANILSRQLRDFCSCPQCRHSATNQRLLKTFALSTDNVHIESTNATALGVEILWAGIGAGAGNASSNTSSAASPNKVEVAAHRSFYDWDWLRAKTVSVQESNPDGHDVRQGDDTQLWTASSIAAGNPPTVDYESVMHSEEGVRQWVRNIRRFGFSYVDGCPVDPDATKKLLERITFIRETHYGDFWDFTSNLASKDMAYTSLELGAHTDTTYFTDPAGLQLFHLLEHTDGQGGQSLLVDGFQAAQTLLQEDPEAVATLKRVQITAHATGNNDAKIITARPFSILDYHGDDKLTAHHPQSSNGKLNMIQVRWNNDDRGSFATQDPNEILAWYRAARKWDEILQRPQSQYWSQLMPGRPLIFDNWRVLHGRSAFTGRRRLCGAYLNMDDFLSRWRTLEFNDDEIRKRI